MRLGLQLPSFTCPGGPAAIAPTLARVAQEADEWGFASLWVMDHLFQLPIDTGLGGPEEPMLEAYTTLGFLANATQRVRIGAMVGAVHFRHPGLLIKTVDTLDVLSGGRAWFGIGAGWYEREARGLGIPYPDRRDRFDALEDVLRLAHHVWSGDRSGFDGRTVQLPEPILEPRPLSRPHPPIMLGGGGEKRTLRLVARFADACNILVPDPGESRHKLAVLRRHCEEVGRDYDQIEKTALLEVDLRPGHETPAQVVKRLRDQADEGIEHVIVNMPDVHDGQQVRRLGLEVIPQVAEVLAAA